MITPLVNLRNLFIESGLTKEQFEVTYSDAIANAIHELEKMVPDLAKSLGGRNVTRINTFQYTLEVGNQRFALSLRPDGVVLNIISNRAPEALTHSDLRTIIKSKL